MKKFFYPMFALATMAMTTSCSDELENGAVSNGNEATVSFNLQLENAVGSRTIGDGETATELHYAVYKAMEKDGLPAIGDEIANLRCEGTTIINDKKAEVELTLVKGQTYNFFFWAQCPDGEKYYTIDYEKGTVEVNYSDDTATTEEDEGRANNEERDAFFKVRKALKVDGPIEETITLKRPFAQINVGTEIGSLADAATAEVWIQKSSLKVKNVANKLDVYNGAVEGDEEVTFNWSDIPEANKENEEGELQNVDDKDYEYLTMNYILVQDQQKDSETDKDGEEGNYKATINATFNIYGSQVGADQKADEKPINTFEIPNIPVQRNWRTNIIGDILNETVTFNIVIDNEFDNDHNYITEKEVAYAFASGGEVTLDADVTITRPLYAVWSRAENEPVKVITEKTIVVNLNGKTLTYAPEEADDDIMARLGEGATVTFNGPGKVVSSNYIASANAGGTIIINGGEYSGETCTLFQANGGKVYVKDGKFSNTDATNGATYLFNDVDAEKNNGLIEITGGSFVGFNPAASASESPAMNFLKYGYMTTETTNEDETVTYTVVENALEQATMKGGIFTLDADMILNRALTVTKDLTLDLADKSITSSQAIYVKDVVSALVSVKNGATLTIKGEGTIDGSATEDYAVETRGGNLVIENGEFIGGATAAYALVGHIEIKGGKFSQTGYENNNYVLNLKDKSNASIAVTGGEFVGFDPANNAAEGTGTNFVVDGYASTKVGDNYVVTVKTAAEGETVTLTTNGIITNTIQVAGGLLDGNGYTLTQSETPVTNYLVHTTGAATIKNLNIVGANVAWMDGETARGPRAIMIEKLNGDVVIDNVETSGVCYALNVNASSATIESNLIVKNSVLRGWTSYGSGLKSAKFSNVTFAVGNYFTAEEDKQSNGYMRPFVATRLESCSFEKGFKIDENIDGSETYP